MDFKSFITYGWNEHWNDTFRTYIEEGYRPARITSVARGQWHALNHLGQDIDLQVPGRFRMLSGETGLWPAVGDFVAVSYSGTTALIEHVLPRRTLLKRLDSWNQADQVIAANMDIVYIATSLNQDYSQGRLERYLSAAWDSGALPVVVLTKSDLCDDISSAVIDAQRIALGTEVIPVCALGDEGLDKMLAPLKPGQSAAIIGSSGVGKSTLLNAIMGYQAAKTSGIREDDARGRHTTTHREMFLLPGGQLFIDTPGMREMGITHDQSDGLSASFGDIEELSTQCRFSNCQHQSEPGCAVKAALEDGSLDGGRYKRYQKMLKELAHLKRKEGLQSSKEIVEDKKRKKQFARMCKQHKKKR